MEMGDLKDWIENHIVHFKKSDFLFSKNNQKRSIPEFLSSGNRKSTSLSSLKRQVGDKNKLCFDYLNKKNFLSALLTFTSIFQKIFYQKQAVLVVKRYIKISEVLEKQCILY